MNSHGVQDEHTVVDETDSSVGQIALDILENEDTLFIIAPIAGIPLEDIHINLNKNVLTLKGTRNRPSLFQDAGIIVRNSECFWGDFVRNVILPENLNFDDIKAQMEDNLLVISIEKLRFPSQHIKINRVES